MKMMAMAGVGQALGVDDTCEDAERFVIHGDMSLSFEDVGPEAVEVGDDFLSNLMRFAGMPLLIWFMWILRALKMEVQAVFDSWRDCGIVTRFKLNPQFTRSRQMEIRFSLESFELHQPSLEQPLTAQHT